MKSWAGSAVLATLVVAVAAQSLIARADAQDLRNAVPADMFLAVYGKHNPERDYQKQHYQEVWKAVEQTRIVERVVQLAQSHMSEGDVADVVKFRDKMKEALAPIDFQNVLDVQEVVYGQKMEGVFTQNILIMRFPDGAAASLVDGLGNLLQLADEAGGDDIGLVDEEIGELRLRSLVLPQGLPLSPTIGVRGDLFIYSSNPDLAKACLNLLDNPSGASKFEDPRFVEALKQLPEAEDSVVFFDGRAWSEQLKSIVTFIHGVAAGNDEGLRVAGLFDSLIKEVSVFDYVVTVDYTDGYRNLTSSIGKYEDGYEDRVAGKMVANQKSFEDWAKWVPANAKRFSLQSGANLHPLYEWITKEIPEIFPESEEFFVELAHIQSELDIDLEADILQGFGGETVSVTLPGAVTPLGQGSKSVSMHRCATPDRVNELIHRGIDELLKIPQVQKQGVAVRPSQRLEGFEEISAGIFMMMGGMNPTFGFKDGWLMTATHADAIETLLLTRGGENETITSTDKFAQFGIEVPKDVSSISYSNTGASIRETAAGLQQVGVMLPMALAMAGNQNGMAELGPAKDFLSLLPSVGRILAKFDFIESRLSVTYAGPEPASWQSHTVTMIRPPAPEPEPPVVEDSLGSEESSLPE